MKKILSLLVFSLLLTGCFNKSTSVQKGSSSQSNGQTETTPTATSSTTDSAEESSDTGTTTTEATETTQDSDSATDSSNNIEVCGELFYDFSQSNYRLVDESSDEIFSVEWDKEKIVKVLPSATKSARDVCASGEIIHSQNQLTLKISSVEKNEFSDSNPTMADFFLLSHSHWYCGEIFMSYDAASKVNAPLLNYNNRYHTLKNFPKDLHQYFDIYKNINVCILSDAPITADLSVSYRPIIQYADVVLYHWVQK